MELKSLVGEGDAAVADPGSDNDEAKATPGTSDGRAKPMKDVRKVSFLIIKAIYAVYYRPCLIFSLKQVSV